MMEGTPAGRRLTVRIEIDGEELELAKPENFPPLDLFCAAMQLARASDEERSAEVYCRSPMKRVGRLVVKRGLRVPRTRLVETDSLFPDNVSHIAIMRPAELVVRYEVGEAFPDRRLEWAGVFLADKDREVERAFAESEPPAHDDWVPQNLQDRNAKRFVGAALREIKRVAREVAGSSEISISGAGVSPPLARISGLLGSALAGVGTGGAGQGSGGGNSSRGRSRQGRARALPATFKGLKADEGGPVAVFHTEVQQDPERTGVVLYGEAGVLVDGNSASSVRGLLTHPEIIQIRSLQSDLVSEGRELRIDGMDGIFEVLVRVPANCAATLDVRVVQEHAE